MIKSFKDKETQKIFNQDYSKKLPESIQQRALRKLRMIDAAQEINDLRTPPGNRLESLKGGRNNQYSIRINRQWRICFTWNRGDAFSVEIVDYH
jgi:proteic killer suppression protein